MSSSYRLGVDLGTTFTAAATARDGQYAMVELGKGRVDVPSMVCVVGDDLRIGAEAEQLAGQHPGGVVREFKRRLGDPVPLIVDGRPFSPQTLMANLLRWAVQRVAAQEGSLPELVALTCPANWGPFKHELLRQVVTMAELPATVVCTEPAAAAIRHAGADAQREGALVGVYDLGGGTFDAAVLRPTGTGVFTLAGTPEGIEHLGGIDFDEAIYSFVLRSLGQEAFDLAGSDDPVVLAALATLRQGCVRAKEQLSTEHATQVAVELDGRPVSVRITRQEFEAMIRPALEDTVRAFQRALRNADTTPEALTSVVLVGGSTRIPLVFETVSRSLDCQVVIPREPGHSVALGAAMAADRYRPPTTSTRPRARRAPAVASPPPLPGRPPREATVAVGELLRLGPDERAEVATWHVHGGGPVLLGQPLATVTVVGPRGPRRAVLKSPFEGLLHRHFVEEGKALDGGDLLAAFRDVAAFLWRPGRVLPDDQGVVLRVHPPTSATAVASRPVVLLDRVPRGVWWSAAFCLLTEPGSHRLGVAYTGRNQWFGAAALDVVVPTGGLAELDYRDPGTGATAVLQVRPQPSGMAVTR